MAINLTGSTIASTYSQLLHVDAGPTAAEKTVYSGTGVATALKVGTVSASVGNIQLTGNTIQATTGGVNIVNVNVLSGNVPFNVITNRAYAAFYDAGTSDQTGNLTDRTAVKWATASVVGAGVTVVSNSRITFAESGTYRINATIQLANAVNTYHQVLFWFAKNGTDIPNSASRTVVPASSSGGANVFTTEIMETVATNDYIEMYWLPTDLDVTLHYTAPVAENPGVTPAIPAIPPARVVVEKIA